MSQLGNYYENIILSLVIGHNTTLTGAVTRYFALFNTTDANLEAGSLVGELSGSNYARFSGSGTVLFGVPTIGNCKNITDLLSNVASANWATVTHIAMMDAASGGTVLLWSVLTNPGQVLTGKQFRIQANTWTLTAD